MGQTGRGGRGSAGGRTGGRNVGRGAGGCVQGYAEQSKKPTRIGLYKDLEGNIFDYGAKTAADQMKVTQEKIVQYVGMTFSMDIANKLKNQKPFVVPPAN